MCTGDVRTAGVALWDLDNRANDIGGMYGRSRSHAAVGPCCEVVNIDLLVGRTSHDNCFVQGKHAPYRALVAL